MKDLSNITSMSILCIIATIALLCIASYALAEQTVKTVEVPIGYVAQTIAANDYITTITINPPDGIENIISMEIMVKGDFQASTAIKSRVRKTGTAQTFSCEPDAWTTPNLDEANYEASFDCSSLVDKYDFTSGKIDVGFQTNKIARNVKGYIRMTYYNNPPFHLISIGGTEYSEHENARIVVQLIDSYGNPIIDSANCYTTVRTSTDRINVNNESLIFIEDSNGLYYYEFETLLPYGVYSVDSYCNVNGTKVHSADTFHVAKWTEDIGSGINGLSIKRVSGTEYNINDSVSIVVQVLLEGKPTNVAACILDIYEPNATANFSKVVIQKPMVHLNGSNGIYYYQYNGTLNKGIYIADVKCTEGSYNDIPMDYANNATDMATTTSNINGTELNITLNFNDSAILVIMTVEGYLTGSVPANGTWFFSLDGVDYGDTAITRTFSGANQEGSIVLSSLFTNLTYGSHVIVARHNASLGSTVHSKVNLFAFGLEDAIGKMNYCHKDVSVDTTSSLVMEDVDDLECNLTLDDNSDLFIGYIFSGKTDAANEDISYTVDIDNIDYETHTREFLTANASGSLSMFTVTDAKLNAGFHKIKGRWMVTAGTAAGESFHLFAIATRLGNSEFQVEKAKKINIKTTSTVPEDMKGVTVTLKIENQTNIAGLMSLVVTSSTAGQRGYFLHNIDNADKEIFTRYFNSSVKEGSVGLVQTTDILQQGSYVLKGRWYTDAGNELKAKQGTYIGIVFQTEPIYSPSYYALDFHVTNRTELTDAVSKSVWNYQKRNLTYTNYGQIAEFVWNYTNRTVNLSEVMSFLNYINSTIASYHDDVIAAIENLNNISSYDVWTYTTRNLTFYPSLDYGQISSWVWNYTNRSLTDNIAEIVWTYNTRNLTYINFTEVLDRIDALNNSNQQYFIMIDTKLTNLNNLTAEEVWSYINRTLTDYNQTDVINAINQNYISIQGLSNLTASEVWSYAYRTLTDYNQTGILNYLQHINTTTWDTNYWVKQNNLMLYNITIGNVTIFASLNWSKLTEEVWNKTNPSKIRHDLFSFADDKIQTVTPYYQQCVGNATLETISNVTNCIMGQCYSYNITDYQRCQYGCFEDKCRPDPMWTNLVLIIIIICVGAGMFAVNAVVH